MSAIKLYLVTAHCDKSPQAPKGIVKFRITASTANEAAQRFCANEPAPMSAIKSIQEIVKIETLKKDDSFIFPNGKTVYIFKGYNSSIKKYEYSKALDFCDYGKKKKGTEVITDIDY